MSRAVRLNAETVAALEPELYAPDAALFEPLAAAAPPRPSQPLRSSGKHDAQARRRAQRRGRERGCWVYIAADGLAKAGFEPDEPPPWYRVWGGQRGRYVAVLYREP